MMCVRTGREAVPPLLAVLETVDDPQVQTAATLLQSSDYQMEPDQVGAALFVGLLPAMESHRGGSPL